MSIRPDQIPQEVVEAARKAFHENFKATDAITPWKAAIAAASAAWPGVAEHTIQVPDEHSDDIRYTLKKIGLILPLQEPKP